MIRKFLIGFGFVFISGVAMAQKATMFSIYLPANELASAYGISNTKLSNVTQSFAQCTYDTQGPVCSTAFFPQNGKGSGIVTVYKKDTPNNECSMNFVATSHGNLDQVITSCKGDLAINGGFLTNTYTATIIDFTPPVSPVINIPGGAAANKK